MVSCFLLTLLEKLRFDPDDAQSRWRKLTVHRRAYSTPQHTARHYLESTHWQAAFPLADLIESNKRRNRGDMKYELLDMGVFNEDRYFDVFVEWSGLARLNG